MTFAQGIGTTFTLGRYTVRIALRPDNPAFAKYLIFRGDKLIGRQFSRPCESDCQWLERCGGEYATESKYSEHSSVWARARAGFATAHTSARRGRPRKGEAERELREAMLS